MFGGLGAKKKNTGAMFGGLGAKKKNTSIVPSGGGGGGGGGSELSFLTGGKSSGGGKTKSLNKGNTIFDQNINQRMRKTAGKSKEIVKAKLSRVQKVRLKKKAMQAKIDGQMGTSNEDQKVGSISMTKILMNHIHMMSMIPLFDSNFLTNLNKTFFNSVGSIFGLYTGSAIECYFDYDEMFPLAQKRALLFMMSPFIVVFVVGGLWLPLHFCQDHKKTYYGSLFTKLIALVITVLDNLYPVLTLETLKLLPCTTMFQGENPCDNRKFMMIDLDIECGRDVRHGTILYGFGMPMLWVYVIGIPFVCLTLIIVHRKDLHSPKTHIRLNAIMAGFQVHKKWWSVVVMLRKTCFIAAAIMFKDFGPFLQIFSGAFVVCIFAYLHFINAPYVLIWTGVDEETCEYEETIKTDVLHQMEGSSLMIELITLFW